MIKSVPTRTFTVWVAKEVSISRILLPHRIADVLVQLIFLRGFPIFLFPDFSDPIFHINLEKLKIDYFNCRRTKKFCENKTIHFGPIPPLLNKQYRPAIARTPSRNFSHYSFIVSNENRCITKYWKRMKRQNLTDS